MKRIFTTLVSIVVLQFAGFLAIAQWQALPSPTGLVINDITYHDSRFFLSTKTGVYTLHPDEDEVKYYDMGIEGVENVNFFYAKNDAELFVGTQTGLYRSLDGGTSWVYLSNDIDRQETYSLVEDGENLVIAAGRRIYVSENNGTNWETLDGLSSVDRITKCRDAFLIEINSSLYRTTALEPWSVDLYLKQNVMGNEFAIHVVGDTVGILSDTHGIYLSYNAGEDWESINDTYPGLGPDALFLDRESLWMTAENSVYKASYEDRDWKWVFSTQNQPLERVYGKGSQIIGGAANLVIRSSDSGSTWANLTKGFPTKKLVFKISHNDELYSRSSDGEIYKWNDTEWKLHCTAERNNFPVESWFSVGNHWFALSGSETYLAKNLGSTWASVYNGAIKNLISLDDSTVLGTLLYKGVMKSTDGGETWKTSSIGIDNASSMYYNFFFKQDQTVYLRHNATFYSSEDKGESWKNIGDSIHSLQDVDKVFQLNNTVLFATYKSENLIVSVRLFKSTNGNNPEEIPLADLYGVGPVNNFLLKHFTEGPGGDIYTIFNSGFWIHNPSQGWRRASKGLPAAEYLTEVRDNKFNYFRHDAGLGNIDIYQSNVVLLLDEKIYSRKTSDFLAASEAPQINQIKMEQTEKPYEVRVNLSWVGGQPEEITHINIIEKDVLKFIQSVDKTLLNFDFAMSPESDSLALQLFATSNGDDSYASREVKILPKVGHYWELSDKAEITSFELEDAIFPIEIDSVNQRIQLVINDTSDITSLKPIIQISEHATIYPPLDQAQDFSLPFVYKVTASMGNVKEWVVEVERYVRSDNNDILEFNLPQQTELAIIDTENHTVSVEVKARTNIARLTPTIVVQDSASVTPPSGTRQDFTSSMIYSVTAENGAVQGWKVHVHTGPLSARDLGDSELKVYPNPGKHFLSVEGYAKPVEKIQIMDVTGKMYETRYEEAGNSTKVDIGFLSPGSYFLKVKSGEKIFYSRFIKQ